MSFSDCDFITQLTSALDSSVNFYTAAAESTKLKSNAAIFRRIATARTTIITHLQPFTYHDHREPAFYAFGSVLQKVYPDMFFELDETCDPALVAITQHTESELGELLKNTLAQIQSPLLRALLVDLFPELNGSHAVYIFEHAC